MAGVTANSPNSFTFSPTKTTAYTLYITDANGCTTTENLVVKVSQDPTGCITTNEGFTPNGDNVNDRWELPCIYSFQNKLTVYNRWGQLVYEKENYDGSWTGDYQRKSLPDGTYYYVLELQINGKTNTQKGTVSIFR
jgi:gliding motility-associated-like protein